MLERIKQIGERIVGTRKKIEVDDFAMGSNLSGGERLRRDLNLDFTPKGTLEAKVIRRGEGRTIEIDIGSLRG